MKERLKDWLFLVTAIAFGIYLSRWLMAITAMMMNKGIYG